MDITWSNMGFGSAWPRKTGGVSLFTAMLGTLVSQLQCRADMGTGSSYPQERFTLRYFGNGHTHIPFALTSQL